MSAELLGHFLIGGRMRAARGGRTFAAVNPATAVAFGSLPDGDDSDAARATFDTGDWPRSPELRAGCLRALAAEVGKVAEELRELLVRDGGVPLRLTRTFHLDGLLTDLDGICTLLEQHEWRRLLPPTDIHGFRSARLRTAEPVGVVALLTPANAPLALVLRGVDYQCARGIRW